MKRALRTAFPDFDADFLGALSVSMPVSIPSFPPDETISPCLLDRMWPDMWMPGINPQHEQARGLLLALPMWERSGNTLHDLLAGNAFRLGG